MIPLSFSRTLCKSSIRLTSIAYSTRTPLHNRRLLNMSTDTSKYKLNHSMLRIKDPKKTIEFYSLLGLKVINKLENPESNFDLYFLGYDSSKAVSHGKHWTDREGLIELTHNYGTENDPSFQANNGNAEPYRGFGHVCISVDHIQAVQQNLIDAGYKFQKKLTDGRNPNILFVLDPDGYWVEMVSWNKLSATQDETTTDFSTYRMNHTMLRVKDAKKSLAFYQDMMGMKLLRTVEQEAAKFNLYFLGYSDNQKESTHDLEGLLELTWNYGTEDDADFKYHNGNDEPQGFGHICVSVDDLDAACERWEKKDVTFKKKLTEGKMKDIAFLLDPDGYWIEIVQNETLKKRVEW